MFKVPFVIVSGLFVMNISIIAIFGSELPIVAGNPMFSYGAMALLYVICILEVLGFSMVAKFISSKVHLKP